mmetsp:Transcript_2049/g.3967  ORF Transcript_2049/g.3967 Transcript_2049/m.3967 type:complete len:203 (-) Transcript_2049:1915-2523(-)
MEVKTSLVVEFVRMNHDKITFTMEGGVRLIPALKMRISTPTALFVAIDEWIRGGGGGGGGSLRGGRGLRCGCCGGSRFGRQTDFDQTVLRGISTNIRHRDSCCLPTTVVGYYGRNGARVLRVHHSISVVTHQASKLFSARARVGRDESSKVECEVIATIRSLGILPPNSGKGDRVAIRIVTVNHGAGHVLVIVIPNSSRLPL